MGQASCGTGKRFVMCPRYCEIFGPGACAGVFQPERCRLKKFPVPDEHSEQVFLFHWWNLQYHDHPALLFAIPNGGARDPITGKRLKDEGVMAGIPDICLSWPSGGYHGLFIEMKRERGGKVSKTQEKAISALRNAGYCAEVCKGWIEARDLILSYMKGNMKREVFRAS